jgi:hypothetical protein
VDHRVSKVTGGGDEDDNLVAACSDCNFGKGATSDQDDGGIVLVHNPDGSIDHKRSLRLSGLWGSFPKESRECFLVPVRVPLDVILRDVLDAERGVLKADQALRNVRELAFRARAHAWFTDQ